VTIMSSCCSSRRRASMISIHRRMGGWLVAPCSNRYDTPASGLTLRPPCLYLAVLAAREDQLLLVHEAETPDNFFAVGAWQPDAATWIQAPQLATLGEMGQCEHLPALKMPCC
jgi:hypothetical protein